MEQDPPTVELLGMGKLRTTAWQLLCGWFYQCSIPELFFGLEGFIFGHHSYSEIPIPPHGYGRELLDFVWALAAGMGPQSYCQLRCLLHKLFTLEKGHLKVFSLRVVVLKSTIGRTRLL